MSEKKINSVLISVYHKEGLDDLISSIKENNIKVYSTGGTQTYLESKGLEVVPVESITGYPSVFGGRVKTLHPAVFGGILQRRDNEGDQKESTEHEIPTLDMIVVDLYPFEETVASTNDESEIIEKIDIGGISLIRAAAKNYQDVVIVPSQKEYEETAKILKENNGATSLEERRQFAKKAFAISSHYDSKIFEYFSQGDVSEALRVSENEASVLRYGENPHQQATFFGDLDGLFEQLNGKALSYNNLVDIDGAVGLVEEFQETAFAIIKHTNACGMATGNTVLEAYEKALAGDPVSAFGGILCTNKTVDIAAAEEINKLFFEVLIAPDYSGDALDLLKGKKNRIILKKKRRLSKSSLIKSALDGLLVQDKDNLHEGFDNLENVTKRQATEEEKRALIFANVLAKHTKSNVIVIAREGQLLGSGVGQTSRVDAARQAIAKAKHFGFDIKGAVMASDAFFPFPDCVEIAHESGISAVIQPGGSIRDKDSIEVCDKYNMAMVLTGNRHFKH